MVNIGVLTDDGQMYLVQAPNITGSEKGEDIQEVIADFLELSEGSFNWQVLAEEMQDGGTTTAFRNLTLLAKIKEG